MILNDYKVYVNKQNTKNFRFVKIKANRECQHCQDLIPKGVNCLTVNPKIGNRSWYCDRCVSLMLNVKVARSALNSVAFDDEGAGYACQEWLDEAISELEEVRVEW